MNLGFCSKDCNEFRDAVVTGIAIFVLDFLNKLPEAELPTLSDVYRGIRLGIISTITFYLINKGIRKPKTEGETE